MNEKLISKAVECYAEKLEEENKALKAFMEQIADAFSFKGDNKNRTNKDILDDIINILRYYEEVYKEENENG